MSHCERSETISIGLYPRETASLPRERLAMTGKR